MTGLDIAIIVAFLAYAVAAAVGTEKGRDTQRLLRGLAAAGVAALSLFCLLAGLGSWMAGSPPPLWLRLGLRVPAGAAPVPKARPERRS